MSPMNEQHPQNGGRFDIRRDLFCTADSEGHFTSLNGAWESVLGWGREEIMARSFLDLVHPEDRRRTLEVMGRSSEEGYELAGFENRYRTRSGQYRRLRWAARTDGTVWFAVAFDVTDEHERAEQLKRMLCTDRFLAYGQPIAGVNRPAPERDELLIRLSPDDPNEGPVLPHEFVPAAERLGMVGMIDRWMVEQGVRLARRGTVVQVNLSPVTLEDADFGAEVEGLLHEQPVADGALIFELTETAMMQSFDAAREFALRMVPIGCRFAIDDWGTGFGSLTRLRELPFSYLKIDESFVTNCDERASDGELVQAIVAFAAKLGLRTVAEGVETREVLALLGAYGVDYAQGYLLGRPRPMPVH